MAFPVVGSRSASVEGSNTQNHTVTLPASIATGDLLVCVLTVDGGDAITFTGWISFVVANEGSVRHEAFWRKATTSDPNTFTTDGASGEQTTHRVWRFTSASITDPNTVPPQGGGATGSGSNPDPPSFNPTWSSGDDTYWLATCGRDDDDSSSQTYPTNYDTGQLYHQSDTSGSCEAAYAEDEVSTSGAEDPGNFDLGNTTEGWGAFTIAIPPSGASPPTLDIVQTHFRIRADDAAGLNDNAGGDWGAALDTGLTEDLELRFRIRFELDKDAAGSIATEYELWQSTNSGAYLKVPSTPLDWSTRSTTALVEHVQSKQYTDTAPATTDILTGADAFTAGDGVGEGGVTGTITLDDQSTEVEFCLLLHRIADAQLFLNDGDTIDFRVREAGGQLLKTYTNTPQITVNYPAGLVGGVYAENPGALGPFDDGSGNKYVVIEGAETDNKLMMMLSTDGGDSWNVVDDAGRPTQGDLEGLTIVPDFANDRLLIGHHRNDVLFYIFNTAGHGTPNEWSLIDEEIDAAILDSGDQQIAMALRSDGSIIAAYTGDITDPSNDNDVWVNIRSAPPTPTWGTPFQAWARTNDANFGVVGVLGDNDHFYIFSHDDVSGDLLGKRINGSTDALEDMIHPHGAATAADAGTVIGGGSTGNSQKQNHTEPQYWLDGSTPSVFIAWVTSAKLQGVVIDVGSGGSVGSRGADIQDADNLSQSLITSRQPVASVIRHSNGEFHAFFTTWTGTGSRNANLVHDVSTDDGATWGTNETVAVRSPKSRINLVRAFEQPDGNIALFYDDASGLEQNNTAAGGDDDIATGGHATGFVWYDEFRPTVYPPSPRRQNTLIRM